MEPADRGVENWGMYVKYPSVKLLTIVAWKEWHILVLMPNNEDKKEQGNKQDKHDKEEQ